MIPVQFAVQVAQQKLQELYPLDDTPYAKGMQLEEVYLSDDETSWNVTLSFLSDLEPDEMTGLGALLPLPLTDSNGKSLRKKRVYKTFEIDAMQGEFRGMKIRPVASV